MNFSRFFIVAFIAILMTATSPCRAQAKYDEARLKQIAGSRYWQVLIHYRPATFSKFKSQVTRSPFFLSPEGLTDPLAELKATLAFFQTHEKMGRYQQTPQCAFPERYRFLKSQLKITEPEEPCPDLKEWLLGFSADSATLVYSSAFPNNPASIFGHTLLRINSTRKRNSPVRQDLLDYSVSYAAAMGDTGPLALAFKGLFGGFEGVVTVQPYYMKVNEYVASENRDIWEYDLNLKPEQVENMLRHVWELQNSAYFNYYFIDENCAYFMLALLEIANPNWNLLDRVPWYLSPTQSVKILVREPGVVTSWRFRPSAFKVMQHRLETLDRAQLDKLRSLLAKRVVDDSVTHEPGVVDAALDDLQYLRTENKGQQSPEDKAFYRALLVARSKMASTGGDNFDPSTLSQDSRPDQSHDSTQVGTSIGAVNERAALEFHVRAGLSDFVNDDTGFTPNSSMRWIDGQIRVLSNPGSIVLENLEALQVRSLFPRGEIHRDLSWGINIDYLTPHDLDCDVCKALHTEASAGGTWRPARRWTQALLLSANSDVGPRFQRGYRFGPSLDLETILQFTRRIKTHLLIRQFFQGDFSGQSPDRSTATDLLLEGGWTFSQTWDARLKARWIPPDHAWRSYSEFFAGLNYYFD